MKFPRLLAALLCCTYVLTLLLLTGAKAPSVDAREGEASRDVVILLDVTVSMINLDGDTADIWVRVRDGVTEQIRQLPDGIQFAVVPFTKEPRLELVFAGNAATSGQQLEFVTSSPTTRDAAIQHVASIAIPSSANAPNISDHRGTYICSAVDYALTQFAGWRVAQGGAERTQNLYLFTDGIEDDPACAGEDFGNQLSEKFNGRKSELPFLYFVYVDLGEKKLDAEDQAAIEQGGGTVLDAIPTTISIVTPGIDLGNVAVTPQVTATIQLGSGVLTNAQGTARQASLTLSSNMAAFSVDSIVTLAPTMTVTFQAPAEHPFGARFTGTLQLEAIGDEDVVFSPALIPITYSWEPAPTPTPTATATIAATATAMQPTPTPEPTMTPVPTPTPTPIAGITVERDDPADLGELSAGSGDRLEGTSSLMVTFDQGAIANNSSVDLRAQIDGDEDAARFWIIDPVTNAPDSTVSLMPNGQPAQMVTVGYSIPAGNAGMLPGSTSHDANVVVTSTNATVTTEDVDGPGDGTFAYTYTEKNGIGAAFIALLVLLLVLLLLVLWVLLHARFPANAIVTDPAGNPIPLRRASERSLFARLFKASEIPVGPNNGGLGINLETMSQIGTLTPRRNAFSFGSRTLVRPEDADADGFGIQQLLVNGQPLTSVMELGNGDTLHLQFQNPATYQQ